MSKKELNTEEKILDAAVDVFVDKGYDGARMQEIADHAGINKALLHYYFRNKQKLFIQSFERLLAQFFRGLVGNIASGKDLKEVITMATREQLNFFKSRKKLPLFILNTLQQHPEIIKEVIDKIQVGATAQMIMSSIAKFKGIDEEQAKMWFVTFMSTRMMPIVGAELYKHLLGMDDRAYDAFLDKQHMFSIELMV